LNLLKEYLCRKKCGLKLHEQNLDHDESQAIAKASSIDLFCCKFKDGGKSFVTSLLHEQRGMEKLVLTGSGRGIHVDEIQRLLQGLAGSDYEYIRELCMIDMPICFSTGELLGRI